MSQQGRPCIFVQVHEFLLELGHDKVCACPLLVEASEDHGERTGTRRWIASLSHRSVQGRGIELDRGRSSTVFEAKFRKIEQGGFDVGDLLERNRLVRIQYVHESLPPDNSVFQGFLSDAHSGIAYAYAYKSGKGREMNVQSVKPDLSVWSAATVLLSPDAANLRLRLAVHDGDIGFWHGNEAEGELVCVKYGMQSGGVEGGAVVLLYFNVLLPPVYSLNSAHCSLLTAHCSLSQLSARVPA